MKIQIFLGNKLRKFREMKNETQEEFGKALGVDKSTISKQERGRGIGIESLILYSEKMGIEVKDWFKGWD